MARSPAHPAGFLAAVCAMGPVVGRGARTGPETLASWQDWTHPATMPTYASPARATASVLAAIVMWVVVSFAPVSVAVCVAMLTAALLAALVYDAVTGKRP